MTPHSKLLVIPLSVEINKILQVIQRSLTKYKAVFVTGESFVINPSTWKENLLSE